MKILTSRVGFSDFPGMTTLDIYAVGCSIRCDSCHNPELRDPEHPEAHVLNVHELTEKINAAEGLIEAICWMGGEPLDQSVSLLILMCAAKFTHPSLPHIVFTGRTLEEIQDDYNLRDVLGLADAVKTGRWNGIPLGSPGCSQKIYIRGEEVPYDQVPKRLAEMRKC